jgi:hypothetical protein
LLDVPKHVLSPEWAMLEISGNAEAVTRKEAGVLFNEI